MPNRETLFLRALPAAVIALAVSWALLRWQPAGGLATVLVAAVWLALAAAVALVLAGARRAGAWALVDLALVGVPFAIAAAWLRAAGHDALATACLVPLALGVPGSILAAVSTARAARRSATADRRAEALREIARIHWRLWTGSAEVGDDEVHSALDELAASGDPDPRAVAARLFGAIAPVCAARPGLTPELLRRALDPLVTLDIRTAADVLQWVETDVLPAIDATTLETDRHGRRWLEQELPGERALLQRILDEPRVPA